jgi:hypothetical protein
VEACPDVPWGEPEPCDECPRVRLDQYLQFTEAGRLIRDALDLDWATKCGLHLTLADVSYPEFLRLRVLQEERQDYELEEFERVQQEAEQRRQMNRGRK